MNSKFKKEVFIGIIVVLLFALVIIYVADTYVLLSLFLSFLVAVISIKLFSSVSKTSKLAALILNPDIFYKLLMPKKHRKGIEELKKKRKER